MAIHVECETCGCRFRVRDDKAGRRVRCPECTEAVWVTEIDEFDDYQEPSRPQRRQRPSGSSRGRKRKRKQTSAVPIFIAAGVGLVVVIGVVLLFALRGGDDAPVVADQNPEIENEAKESASSSGDTVAAQSNPKSDESTEDASSLMGPDLSKKPMGAKLKPKPDPNVAIKFEADPAKQSPEWGDFSKLKVKLPSRVEMAHYSSTPSPFVLVAHASFHWKNCQIWNLATQQKVGRSIQETGHANRVALSPDGEHIAISLVDNDNPCRMEIWSTETGQKIYEFSADSTPKSRIRFLEFVDTNRLLTWVSVFNNSSFRHHFQIWDLSTGEKSSEVEVKVSSFVFSENAILSPGGRYLVTHAGGSRNTADVWDVTTGKAIRSIELPTRSDSGDTFSFETMRFAPDGKRLAILQKGSNSTQIIIRDLESNTSTYDKTIPVDLSAAIPWVSSYDGLDLDWFNDRSILLYGTVLLDIKLGRILWTLHALKMKEFELVNNKPRHIVPGGLIIVDGPRDAHRLEFMPVPWKEANEIVSNMENDEKAVLRPGKGIRVKVTVKSVRLGDSDQTQTELEQLFAERLAVDGIKVDPDAEIVLEVTYGEGEGNTLQEIRRSAGQPLSRGAPTGKSVQTTKGIVALEVRSQRRKRLYAKEILVNPRTLFFQGEITPEKARDAMFEDLKAKVRAELIPYYMGVTGNPPVNRSA